MRRRVLLQGVGIGAVAASGGTAGCLDDRDLAEDAAADDPAENTSDDGDPVDRPSIVSEVIETTATACASGESAVSEATVETGTDWVKIGGGLEAPNPCYEAVLDTVELVESGSELAVMIDTEREDETEFCQECLGRIEYTATIEFEGGVPEAVTVTHAERDSEAIVEEAATDDAPADVGGVENETAADE